MCTCVFISLKEIPRRKMPGLYGKIMFNFFFKKLPNCFPKRVYCVTFPQQCMRVPVSPHPLQSCLFITVTLIGMWWCPHCVSICISLVTDDSEHHFMYLLAIHISFLVRCLFKLFLIGFYYYLVEL